MPSSSIRSAAPASVAGRRQTRSPQRRGMIRWSISLKPPASSAAMIAGHCVARGRFTSIQVCQHVRSVGGIGVKRSVRLRSRIPNVPSDPTKSRADRKPFSAPPKSTTVPSDQYDSRAEHVIGGGAVLQAVNAAGVLCDVAADGAG